MKRLLYAVVALSLLALYGCSGDSNGFSSVGVPNQTQLQPKGTIQGVLTDSVTNQPIVNAIVDIGVGRAQTNENGQYVIYNVPATTDSVAGVQTVAGTYSVTIDLNRVTSPVNMVTPPTGSYVYPKYAYTMVSVPFTSLNDSNPGSGSSPGSTSSSNGATPVTGLVANCPLKVGKLSAAIEGEVINTADSLPVGAGFEVAAYAFGTAIGDTPGIMIARTTTDANGKFRLSNLSAATTYTIGVRNADQSITNLMVGQAVLTSAEGITVFVTRASGTPITVAPVANGATPMILSVTPANLATVPVGPVEVIYTFNYPITQNGYTQGTAETTSNVTAIYNDVAVNFVGFKASNIAHSLTWVDDKTLKVTIPSVGVSSIYSVDISAVLANANFKSLKKTVSANGKAMVTFYTAGGAVSAAPTVTISNDATLNFNGPVNLVWNAAQNAKKYNIYRSTSQVFGSSSNIHDFVLVASGVAATTWADTTANLFVENPTGNHIKLTYQYKVAGVNSDGLETASTAVTAVDKVGPQLLPSNFNGQLAAGTDTLTINFNEPLDKATAQTAANYTLSNVGAVTVTSATYDETTWQVTLKLSAAIKPADIQRSYIDTGANGILESVAGPADVATINFGNGDPGALAIGPGPNNVINTPLGGDDALGGANSITTGPNGKSESTAAGDDVQVIAVGKGKPNVAAIAAGPTLILGAVAAGDDVLVNPVALKVSGVKDVAGNVIDTKFDGFLTNGNVTNAP